MKIHDRMRPGGRTFLLPVALTGLVSSLLHAESPRAVELDTLTVHAPGEQGFLLAPLASPEDPTGIRSLRLDLSLPTLSAAPDVAEWLRQVPGAAPVANGPLAGQVQLRGMWGPRVDTRIDGMPIEPACPNWMDPVLHHVPRGTLESMEVYRGLAPVRLGPETLGGAVRVRTRSGQFTDSSETETRGNLNASLHSVDSGENVALFLAQENDQEWNHVFATHDKGEDRAFGGGGDVTGTQYDRSQWGLGMARKIGDGTWRFDARRQASDPSGTPALPMDLLYSNVDLLRLAYEGTRGDVELEGKVYYGQSGHLMDNYSLRTPPGGRRRNYTTSQDLGFDLSGRRAAGRGEVRWGGDVHMLDFDGLISDPGTRFLSAPFSDIERNRYSVFGEWEGPFRGAWDLEAGLRVTHVSMRAGLGVTPNRPPVRALAQRFAAGDRDIQDTNLDVVLRFSKDLAEGRTLEVGMGRKTRSPTYNERFAYLPMEATSGYADANNTIGNLGLDPEAAYTIDLGLSLRKGRGYFTPRVFYTRIDDFIQQTPTNDPTVIAVSTGGGDPTPLQYNNVDAHLWGSDAAFGRRLSDRLRLDGTISYVRGRRRDIADNLFRIAPLNGTLALTREQGNFSLTAQGVFAAKQEHLSTTNSEPYTAGHGVLNLFAQKKMRNGTRLTAGVENVFDLFYKDHLASFNRVLGSQIGATARPTSSANRIPGSGRNFFLRVDVPF